MPFQSEKQRRFLHANHPEIAKRWERDYGDGGMAQLNAQLNQLPEYYLPAAKGGIANHFKKRVKLQDSIESLSDTEFQTMYPEWDPNQFTREEYLQFISENEGNGVLDLRTDDEAIEVASTEENEIIPDLLTPGSAAGILRLKDGGTPRRRYFTGAYGGGNPNEDRAAEESRGSWSPGVQHSGMPTSTPTRDEPPVRSPHLNEEEETRKFAIQEDIRRREEEKYDKPEDKFDFSRTGKLERQQIIINNARDQWEQVRDSTNEKLKKKVGKKIVQGLLLGGVTFGIGDFVSVMVQGYKQNKAKQEFIGVINDTIAEYKDLGIPEHSPHTDTLIQKLNQEILDLTQTRDTEDEGPDGPPLTIDVLAETQEAVEEAPDMISMMDRIRANQAKRAMLVDKGIIQENPIVDESVTDITMTANKGGLANLFRVKKQ